jgi:AcrR family transcriptional regulator
VARTPRDEAREARTGVYRQHILEAAEHVFAERGFETAKVQEISVKAGLSMGVIYGIFPGKTELYTALLDERGQELLRLARQVAGRELTPKQQLLELIGVYVGYFVEHPDFLRMHLRSGVSWALGSAIGTATSVQYWADIHELQADIFRRGVAAGQFVDEAPDYLARTFSVMDQVLLSDWVARGMTDERDALVARLSRMVQRAFCVG